MRDEEKKNGEKREKKKVSTHSERSFVSTKKVEKQVIFKRWLSRFV